MGEPKKKKMTEDELLRFIDQELKYGVTTYAGASNSELKSERRKAIEYYYGEKFGNEVEGRSKVVMTDVLDTIEWIMPSLMRVFCSGDECVNFQPVGPGDEKQAELETQYAHYVFFRENEGFKILYDFFKDALIQKCGITKTFWDDTPDKMREEYSGLTDAELQMLVNDPDIEILEYTENQEMIPPVEGQLEPMPITTHDVVVARTLSKGRTCVESVPPEEFIISRRARSINQSPLTAHRILKTISDLRKKGYKNLDGIASDSEEEQEWDEEYLARHENDDDTGSDYAREESVDEASRRVWITEVYMHVDFDGDGIAELRKVTKAGNRILDNEPIDENPFSACCPIPMPHKFFGLSLADIVMELQLIRSTILRSLLDNFYMLNNGRWEVLENKVNLDDLLTSRPGGMVRVKERGSVNPLNAPPLPVHAFSLLELTEKIRDSRTGVGAFSQGLDPSVLQNATAAAVAMQTSAANSRVELIARIFAETGVKDMLVKIHGLCRRNQDKAKQVRINGEWTEVDPSKWGERRDVTVGVGLGYGNREQTIMSLQALGQQVAGLRQDPELRGMVPPQKIYNMLEKGIRAMGFKNPDEFLESPEKAAMRQQGQQQGPDPQQIEAQIKAQELQLKQQEMQMKMQESQQEMAVKAKELQLKEQEAALDFRVKEQELRMKAQELQIDLAELQLEAVQDRPVQIGDN